jgi:hypothetical protein
MFRPLTIEPRLVNPFKEGLGMDVFIYIPNPGPLYADFGILTTRLFHKDELVGYATVPEPVIIKNKKNGGEEFGVNKIQLQVRIKLSKNPIKAWQELTDMLRNFKNYKVDIEASSPEFGRLDWITQCFQQVPEFMKGQIFPLMIALLHNVKVRFSFSLVIS